jgi:predicted MFS family arabinose efflux permease
MSMSPLFSINGQLILLALVAVGFDFGVQATLVAHQTIVFSIAPEARSRANALLFTCMFVGMASGSTLGGMALARWGWMGVTAFATATSASALLVRLAWRNSAKRQVLPPLTPPVMRKGKICNPTAWFPNVIAERL